MTPTAHPTPCPVVRNAVHRPVAAGVAVPTLVRPRQDSALFRGWGVTL